MKTPDAQPDLRTANLWQANLQGADLTRVNLERAYLQAANLKGADLRSAELAGANLSNANLSDAFLGGATLSGTNLSGTKLVRANLVDTNLESVDLTGSDLRDSKLHGANLKGARISWTSFSSVDLREVVGLDLIVHIGPSSIDSRTLERSQGQIPDFFLTGCGLPNWAVLAAKLYDPDLRPDEIIDLNYRIADLRTHAPIVPLSVFVSYAHGDKPFAEQLERRLDQDGIRFWRDVHHLVAGPLEAQVDRAITIHGAVLLVLSQNSVASDWVVWEIQRARELQRELEAEAGEPRHRLCPVALDDAWKEESLLPGPLRSVIERYNVLDFSTWRSDEALFEAQYAKLKTGLGIYYRH